MNQNRKILDLVFFLSALVLLAGIIWAAGGDHDREWKKYQRTYRGLAASRTDNLEIKKSLESRPIEIQQVLLEKPMLVDRCVSCHLGYDNPGMKGAPEPFRFHSAELLDQHPVRKFGCTPCHGGQGTATTFTDAAHGLIPDWDDPMPPLELMDSRCGSCHVSDAPPSAKLLADGRSLILAKGCYGCHQIPGFKEMAKPGPTLDSISEKVGRNWLRKWIADPKSYLPDPRMPTFRLKPGEDEELAEYLLTQKKRPLKNDPLYAGLPHDIAAGKRIFGESRCISCHSEEGRGGNIGPDLSKVGDKVKPQWLFEWLLNTHYFQPRTKMLQFGFTPEEAANLTSYLLDEFSEADDKEIKAAAAVDAEKFSPDLAEKGGRLFSELGCIGCHDVTESTQIVRIGPDLDQVGAMPLASLSFGKHDSAVHRRANWLFYKVIEPDFFDPEARMPTFDLTRNEAARIAVALASMRKPEIETAPPPGPEAGPPSAKPAGKFGALLDKYRCLTCHQINGVGGTLSTVDLRWEGSRVNRQWLFNYLKTPYAIRPLLVERMPHFRMSDQEDMVLVSYITQVYVDDSVPDMDNITFTDDQAQAGQSIFQQKGCAACHIINGKGGYVGPDLSRVGERLRPGWIFAWLQDPQRLKPDAVMPVYGFTDPQKADLTAFLMRQRQPAALPAPGGTP